MVHIYSPEQKASTIRGIMKHLSICSARQSNSGMFEDISYSKKKKNGDGSGTRFPKIQLIVVLKLYTW